MENTSSTDPPMIIVIRWIARIISLLAILLVLFFVIAEAMTEDQGQGISTPVINILMGVLMLGGFGLAWKWEISGALMSIIGFIGVIIVNPDAGTKPGMFLFAIPAILFLFCGLWNKLKR